jgi:low affinity Fe/Cu permease
MSRRIFERLAERTSKAAGSKYAFALAFAIILGWAISGPYWRFSDTWQLVINTGTTIVTFLMVFLIQNGQNREMRALHVKLDEIIRSSAAKNALIGLEKKAEEEIEQVATQVVEAVKDV